MKSKMNGMFSIAAIVASLIIASSVFADSTIGNSGRAYVSTVNWITSTTNHQLMVKLSSSSEDLENCSTIYMTVGESGKSIDDLRAFEAAALTAITTGMPIMARIFSTSTCEVSQFRVWRP